MCGKQLYALAFGLVLSSGAFGQESRLSFLAQAPSFNASGFVASLDAGYGQFRESGKQMGSAVGRAEFGYDFAWRQFLIGASAEFVGGGFPKASSPPGALKANSLVSAKAKFGWFFDDWLAFANIGWAHSSVSFTDATTTTRAYADGLLFGGGVEYFIQKDISWNVQMTRYNLGDVTVLSTAGWKTMHPSLQMVTTGLRYRF